MARKVLVVDDSTIVRQQVSSALMDADFECVEALDGEDAARRIGETSDLGMVLCDISMPRMNGIELLEKLSAEGVLARLPVVMLTTDGQPELIARAKALGAKGWMVKPVNPQLIVAAVRKLCLA
jgi:two-component system chemotaxis response regulator CheY